MKSSLPSAIGNALPNEKAVRTVSIAFVAFAVAAAFAGVGSLYFLGGDKRTCFVSEIVVREIVDRLEADPGERIPCDRAYAILQKMPARLVKTAPWYATINSVYEVSEYLQRTAEKFVREHCGDGSASRGELAAFIRREYSSICDQ